MFYCDNMFVLPKTDTKVCKNILFYRIIPSNIVQKYVKIYWNIIGLL